jgi:hypothetical protein
MKKLLAVVIVLVVAGGAYAAYAWTQTPERRLCRRMGELCQVDGTFKDFDECTAAVEKLEKQVGEERVEQAANCVDKADSCAVATGCIAGTGFDVMQDLLRGFMRGFLMSGEDKDKKK